MGTRWLKRVGRDWSISADSIWLNYSGANNENHPGCKIEKYDHAELDLSSSLTDFSWKASVPSLEEAHDGLMLKLPHRV